MKQHLSPGFIINPHIWQAAGTLLIKLSNFHCSVMQKAHRSNTVHGTVLLFYRKQGATTTNTFFQIEPKISWVLDNNLNNDDFK